MGQGAARFAGIGWRHPRGIKRLSTSLDVRDAAGAHLFRRCLHVYRPGSRARHAKIARRVNQRTRTSRAGAYSGGSARERSGAYHDTRGTGAAMIANWAIWAIGMVIVVVNLLAWTLVRINDLPSVRRD